MEQKKQFVFEGLHLYDFGPSKRSNEQLVVFSTVGEGGEIISLEGVRPYPDTEVKLMLRFKDYPPQETPACAEQQLILRKLFDELCQRFPEMLEWSADDNAEDSG